ncbi:MULTISPECIES: hypothetical protein [unclassified Streptomyces]|uniref:SUKH-4 immunity protein of toxin-antitoxin system n=1 Tax=Streptomyces niveiscabiei TaxID=164115 RepID=A0ABW9HSB5_9ACTN|nr:MULTISPECIES: hypothetical protein [unclassified Streptomyces]QZZ31810.1 hypothetical protein A7X85_41335 [Streptomyces sp. ST1015]
MHSPDHLRALLRELDDPDHLELPPGYDLPAARRRFAGLGAAMKERFGPSVIAGMTQDASYYGEVTVPAPDRPLWVLMSNFGPFVTAGTGRDLGVPGCEEGLDESFVTWLDGVCTELGCVYVPAGLLLEPYDGPTRLEDGELPGGGEDEEEEEELPLAWWDRYFQYM